MEGSMHKGNDPVLFLLNSLGIGGSERKTVRIVNKLHENGWNVHLCYLNNPDDLLSSVHTEIPIVFLNRKSRLSPGAICRLRSYVSKAGISKIICINLYPLLYAISARALSGNGAMMVSVMVNTTKHPNRKAQLQMRLYRPLLSNVSELVFGCRSQRDEWRTRYGFEASRCAVIYNGVDENWFSSSAEGISSIVLDFEFGKSASDFIIGSVGNLRPEKNHVELIRAMVELRKLVPNAKVIIVGEGAERRKLEALVQEERLSDCVFFPGQVDDIRPIVNLMDVFVLPSISDTFPNAALEAMSMGKAVILSDSGGSKEMVKDGESGLIYQAHDTSTLVQLLFKLSREPETRHKLGERARATVIAKYSFTRMIEDYELLLQNRLLQNSSCA